MRKKRRMARKWIFRIMALIFSLIIFGTTVLSHTSKDKKFSERENRMLAEKPEITLEGIADGRFMKQYETYQSDQFPGRDWLMQIKTQSQLLLGKKESNGVWKGKDHALLEAIADDSGENVKENLNAVKKFAGQNPERTFYFLLAPNAANIWEDRLPVFSNVLDQNEEIKKVKKELEGSVNWIDASGALKKHKAEDIYYKTDHHWTTLGAYYAFQEAQRVMAADESEQINLKPHAVTDSFNGTLASKSGYETGYREPIYVYLPEKETTKMVVQDLDTGEKRTSLYDSSKLEGKDKYAVFLGGNSGILKIRTTSEKRKSLLIFKDSYANCFIPFLVPYYHEIFVVDPRYYYGEVQSLIEENRIDSILFLYNANTFFGDSSLSGVLE